MLITAVFSGGTALRCAHLSSKGTPAPLVRQAQRVLNAPGRVECLAWSPHGRRLASSVLGVTDPGPGARAAVRNEVDLWQPSSGLVTDRFSLAGPRLLVLAFSADGCTLYGASRRERVSWSTQKRRVPRITPFESGPEVPLSFSPDGRTLVSIADGQARLHDTRPAALSAVLPLRLGPLANAAFSRNGAVLGASDSLHALTYELHTGASRTIARLPQGGILALAVSPDGRFLVCGDHDGNISLWETGSGRLVRRLRSCADPVRSLAFSPDGLLLASGSGSRPGATAGPAEICLWDTRTGRLHQRLDGHQAPVTALAFSPDGDWLASGSYDQTIRLWAIP